MAVIKSNVGPFTFKYDGMITLEITEEGVEAPQYVADVAKERFGMNVTVVNQDGTFASEVAEEVAEETEEVSEDVTEESEEVSDEEIISSESEEVAEEVAEETEEVSEETPVEAPKRGRRANK